MCGITGIYNFNKNHQISRDDLQKMTDAIAHRGPDNEGLFLHQNAGLGYRRLSIIDTTERKQPILTNEDQNLRISFNGEIYNYLTIKEKLVEKGHRFYTGTDTETILHLYEEEFRSCVKHLNGIFAFAILDINKNILFLARDQMGIKPLYYTESSGKVAFASEIKALLELPWIQPHLNPLALNLYFRYRFVPDPLTMFKDIYKLPPGHTLSATPSGIKIEKFWDLSTQLSNKATHITGTNEKSVIESVRKTLKEAVERQLIADVPLGAFLSGGIDSSIIVSLMAELMSEPVKTFSIGFSESKYDELSYARLVSKRYRTDHREIILEPKHIQSLPDIVKLLDEPLADPAAVPFYYLSKMAREHVTVVLTGEGGDELFAGYKENFNYKIANLLQFLPQSLKSRLASLVANLPDQRGKTRLFRSLLTEKGRAEHILTDLFRFEKPPLRTDFLTDLPNSGFNFNQLWDKAQELDWLSKMIYLESVLWLPGDPLMKVDKMTMAHALEARVPLLDLEVVKLAARTPASLKNKGGVEKYLLRQAFQDILPSEIFSRKKFAFEIPIEEWLQSELRPLVEYHLSPQKLKNSPWLESKKVNNIVNKHIAGKRNYKFEIWALLCFQIWHENFLS